jgi:hypothetical protein
MAHVEALFPCIAMVEGNLPWTSCLYALVKLKHRKNVCQDEQRESTAERQ